MNYCKISPDTTAVKVEQPQRPTTPTETQRRVQRVAELLQSVADDPIDPDTLAQLASDAMYHRELAATVSINPHQGRSRFGALRRQVERIMGSTDPRSLQRFLMESKRAGQNIIDALPIVVKNVDDNIARLEFTQRVDDLYKEFRRNLESVGVRAKEDIDELFVEFVEVGNMNRFRDPKIGVNGNRVLDNYHRNFVNKVRNMGVPENVYNELSRMVDSYVQMESQVRAIARQAGVDVGEVDGIGYFSRQFTPDMQRRIRQRRLAELENLGIGNNSVSGKQRALRGRRTFDYVVEDEYRAAEALGLVEDLPNLNRAKRSVENLTDKLKHQDKKINAYSERLSQGRPGHSQRTLDVMQARRESLQNEIDTKQQHIVDAYDQPLRRLNEVISSEDEVLKALDAMSEADLERLIDEGVFSKIPMPSRRVYEHLVAKYDLPYEGLSDLLVTDPVRAHEFYTSQLQRSMGDSNMSVSLVRGAMDNGWGVSRLTKEADPRYADWVPITEVLAAHEASFDLKRLGLETARDLYVSPEIAQTFAALVDVSTQPHHMAWLANIYQGLNRVAKQSQLTSIGFVFKNLFGTTLQGLAAGVNLFHMAESLGDVLKFMREGFDAVDNTRKLYANGTMTARDVMLNMKLRGRLNTTSYIGENATGALRGVRELPTHLRNRARWMRESFFAGDIVGGVGEVGSAISDTVARISSLFMLPTAVFEDAMQLAVLKTRLGDDAMNTIMQGLSFGQVGRDATFDDAISHLNKYFIQFDDTTNLDQFANRNLMTFYTYFTRNLPMQVRHMMRNPAKTAAYMRLYGVFNRDAERRGEDLPEAGVTQWALGGQPIFFQGDSPNLWYSIQTETFDQMSDIFTMIAYDFTNETTEEKVRAAAGEGGVPGWANWLVNQLYPVLKTPVAVLTNQDPFTEGQLKSDDVSFLGFQVPSIAGLNPGAVRYVIENNVPYVRRLNKSNPFQMFGVSEQRNEYGQVVRQAQRSLFGATRTDRDAHIVGDDRELPMLMRAARWLGFSYTEHNVPMNVQRAQSFYESESRNFTRRANELLRQYQSETDESRKERLMHEHIVIQAQALEIKDAADDCAEWLQRRGLPLRETLNNNQRVDTGNRPGDVVDALRNINQ